MAVARKAPKCFLCDEPYKGIFDNRGKTFVGDSFVRWDTEGHVCNRDGLVYFIERMDTHEWYRTLGTCTKEPLRAKFFRSTQSARAYAQYLIDKEIIPSKGNAPEYQITEHMFINPSPHL